MYATRKRRQKPVRRIRYLFLRYDRWLPPLLVALARSVIEHFLEHRS